MAAAALIIPIQSKTRALPCWRILQIPILISPCTKTQIAQATQMLLILLWTMRATLYSQIINRPSYQLIVAARVKAGGVLLEPTAVFEHALKLEKKIRACRETCFRVKIFASTPVSGNKATLQLCNFWKSCAKLHELAQRLGYKIIK
jgi:hypothetical protein